MELTNEVEVTHAGWGRLADEGKETRMKESTCRANEQGPIDQRFKNCFRDSLVGSLIPKFLAIYVD